MQSLGARVSYFGMCGCGQAIMQNLAPLAGPRVAEAARGALLEMFGVWARALSSAFAKYTTADGSLPARLGRGPPGLTSGA